MGKDPLALWGGILILLCFVGIGWASARMQQGYKTLDDLLHKEYKCIENVCGLHKKERVREEGEW